MHVLARDNSLPLPTEKSRVIQFGVFEVDPQEAELRKHGLRIKLQGQPFQILTMLVERPGQTVTREELRQRLWPADTFVDFDHSLNSSIKKLREALGDDSENPRFIETLHRRGYRFIAPVNRPVSPTPGVPALQRPSLAAGLTPTTRRSAAYKWAAVIALIAALLLGFWLRLPIAQPRVIGSKQITSDALPKRAMVTDGNRVYFNEVVPPSTVSTAQVSVGGGEAATVDIPFLNAEVADVSADQSELLIREPGGSYWALPLPAGSSRRLVEVNGHAAAWLPNGKLVFAMGNDIYLAEHDGNTPHKLISLSEAPDWIRLSPDGTRLRFTLWHHTSPRTSSIWEMRVDGSNLHPVFPGWNNPASECCGSWTPDGTYYIFQSVRERASNVWIVRDQHQWWQRGTSEPMQLTTGPLQFERPILSRNGEKLFVSGLQQRAELVRYDPQSSGFIPYLGGISASDPDFSRDGQWVTYVKYPGATLWRSKIDGRGQLQLTYPPMRAAIPHWSPNGDRIAFTGDLSGKSWKTYLIPRDGGAPEVVDLDNSWETDPSWSPDGNALVFSHLDWEHEENYIARFDLKSRQMSRILGSKDIFGPRQSPDGRFIAAVSLLEGKLMMYDFSTEKWKQLNLELKVGYLAWSRDSSYVYFDSRVDQAGYYRLRVHDFRLERLFDLGKIRQFQDMFAGVLGSSWTGLGPGDAPLFVRDLSTQEIYALDLRLP